MIVRDAAGPGREQRIWLLDQLRPGAALHVRALAVEVTGPLDAGLLEESLHRIVERRPELRTAYLDDGRQQVVGGWQPRIASLRPTSGDPDRIAALLESEARVPFDLRQGRLLRAGLASCEPGRQVLVLATHEIACDRYGLEQLVHELAAGGCWADSRLDTAPALTHDPEVDGAALAATVEYWSKRAAVTHRLLELPSDRRRPPVQSFRTGTVTGELGSGLRKGIEAAARAAGCDRGSLLAAAVAVVVCRHADSPELVLALTSERERGTALLHVDCTADPPAATLAAAIAEARRVAAEGSVPFDRLVAALEPDRDLSRAPLAQVLVSVPDSPPAAAACDDVRFETCATASGGSTFDLEFELRPQAERIRSAVTYATDLFDPETAGALVRHLRTVLGAMAAFPEARISELPLLTPGELDELVVRWNATEAAYPPRCLHELVSEQASRTPDAPAVTAEDGTLTYGELDARSTRLAGYLGSLGVAGGDLVAVCLGRSAELLVALLGVLKTGAAYVPVDPDYPAERVASMLENAAATVAVTCTERAAALPQGVALVLLDADADAIEAAPDPISVESDPEQLAYVIYTSGSTGAPKGVEVPHRAVVNLLWEMRQRPGLLPADVVVNVTTFAFDLSVPDLYLPLVVGARLVIAGAGTAGDPQRLGELLDAAGATFVQATPTTWRLLIDAGWTGGRLTAVCGGEAVPAALARALASRVGSAWHTYGPTETTVWSSIVELAATDEPPPLGGPIANTRFAVVDRRGRFVPTGVPGELLIGGDGVARGYRRRPDLTSERFVPDPTRPGATAYRTGDLVRRRRDGTLDFLGRMDDQVKLHGHRIELGEVEHALARHPRVAQAVAVVREDDEGDRRLVAYLVADGAAPTPATLRDHLGRTLPAYMIPTAFAVLDELPRTVNGKVDRRNLPALDGAAHARSALFVAPRTPLEELAADAWAEVIGLERVGVHDHFFELGGNSLLLTRVAARLSHATGLSVPLGRLFALPVLADLAAELAGRLGEASEQDGLVVEPLLGELEAAAAVTG